MINYFNYLDTPTICKIFTYLSAKDLVNLSKTDTSFYKISNLNSLWKPLLETEFPDSNKNLQTFNLKEKFKLNYLLTKKIKTSAEPFKVNSINKIAEKITSYGSKLFIYQEKNIFFFEKETIKKLCHLKNDTELVSWKFNRDYAVLLFQDEIKLISLENPNNDQISFPKNHFDHSENSEFYDCSLINENLFIQFDNGFVKQYNLSSIFDKNIKEINSIDVTTIHSDYLNDEDFLVYLGELHESKLITSCKKSIHIFDIETKIDTIAYEFYENKEMKIFNKGNFIFINDFDIEAETKINNLLIFDTRTNNQILKLDFPLYCFIDRIHYYNDFVFVSVYDKWLESNFINIFDLKNGMKYRSIRTGLLKTFHLIFHEGTLYYSQFHSNVGQLSPLLGIKFK